MKTSITLLFAALMSAQPVQAQNLDALTPEQQKQMLTMLLQQQMGRALQAQGMAPQPHGAAGCTGHAVAATQ